MNLNLHKMLFIIILVLITSITGCNKKIAQVSELEKAVTVDLAQIQTLNIYNDYSGKVRAQDEVMISPKIPGKIEEVNVAVGDVVTEGQILFTLDKNDILDQLRSAGASVNTSQENLRNITESTIPTQRLQLISHVNQLNNQINDFAKTYDEARKSYEEVKIDRRQFDAIQTQYESLKLQLDTANDNLKMFNETTTVKLTDIAKSQLTQAEAGLSQVETQVNNTEVRSPMSGIISSCDIKKGSTVSNMQPALAIIGKELYIESLLSDKAVSKIKIDQKAVVKISSINEKTFDGTVSSISPNADSRTLLYTVKVKIDVNKTAIKSGMIAKITFVTETKPNVLTTQSKAILSDEGIKYVYVVNDKDIATKKVITVGAEADKLTEVVNGLNVGDKVIIEGNVLVNGGDKVKIY